MARRNGCGVRWQSAILTLALAALLAGCALPSLPPLPWQQQARGPTPLPDAQQVLHVATLSGADVNDTFDPALVNDFVSGHAQIISLLYSGLFTLDARLRPVPALATSYTVSADGLRYTFHLRTDARFAEGTPLTSADVAFSLNRVLAGCIPGPTSGLFPDVKDVADFVQMCQGSPQPGQRVITTLIGDALLAPDPSTFVMILTRPDGALISKLAEPYCLIVERSFVTGFGAQWTSHLVDGGGEGTSGMYSVAAWTPWGPYHEGERSDAALTLRAAHDYWGPQPMLRQVDIALRNRQSADTAPTDSSPPIFFALKPSDEIAFDTSTNLFTLQVAAKGLRFSTTPARGIESLALDPHMAPLDDARLRQALVLALDKTQLAKIDDGIATNHLIPPGTGDYPTTLSGPLATAPLTGDVAQAQALWQSYVHDRCGGVASRCPILTIDNIDFDEPTPLAQAISARWRTTLPGLRVVILVFSGLLMDLTVPVGAVHIVPWLEDYPDPQDWLSVFSVEPGSMLFPYPEVPYTHEAQADGLVAQAETMRDPTARLALYKQAELKLINDAVAVPIAQAQDGWAVKPTVVNFPADPSPWIPPAVWARIYLTAPANS